MPGPIVVINPNSDTGVTKAIRDALTGLPLAEAPAFECITLSDSPLTISTDEDVREAGEKVVDTIAARPDAAAFVIACFSDPGLAAAQAIASVPVIGIQRAGVSTAILATGNFGVIALSERSIPRHMAVYDRMGVRDCLAGEVGLSDVSAIGSGTCDAAFRESIDAGRRLAEMGARSIVLGCAGFSPRRAALEAEIGVTVVDPVKAAGMTAVGLMAS